MGPWLSQFGKIPSVKFNKNILYVSFVTSGGWKSNCSWRSMALKELKNFALAKRRERQKERERERERERVDEGELLLPESARRRRRKRRRRTEWERERVACLPVFASVCVWACVCVHARHSECMRTDTWRSLALPRCSHFGELSACLGRSLPLSLSLFSLLFPSSIFLSSSLCLFFSLVVFFPLRASSVSSFCLGSPLPWCRIFVAWADKALDWQRWAGWIGRMDGWRENSVVNVGSGGSWLWRKRHYSSRLSQ